VLTLFTGGLLVAVGAALLVLPGPGLLLVLAGLVVLGREFPAAARYIAPVQERALRAAEESVSSPWRVAGSAATALGLVGAGVVWWVVPELPLGGWGTGSGLMLSGVLLAGLLWWSWRRVRIRERSSGHGVEG
jgi:hypothetical protein